MPTEVKSHRLVVGLSLASGAVGLVPLPVVGDLGIALVRALLLFLLARRHGVQLSRKQTLILAGGLEEPSSWSRLATFGALVVGLRMAWRRLSRAALALLRFDDVARTYLLATYFQHYLEQHHDHNAPALSDEEIRGLQQVIPQACSAARQHLISALFRKTVSDLVRAGTFVPKALWQMAMSAMAEGEGDRVEQVVEEDVDGFFARITKAVEGELSATREVTVEALYSAFDGAWEAHVDSVSAVHRAAKEHSDEHDDT